MSSCFALQSIKVNRLLYINHKSTTIWHTLHSVSLSASDWHANSLQWSHSVSRTQFSHSSCRAHAWTFIMMIARPSPAPPRRPSPLHPHSGTLASLAGQKFISIPYIAPMGTKLQSSIFPPIRKQTHTQNFSRAAGYDDAFSFVFVMHQRDRDGWTLTALCGFESQPS